MRPAPKIAVFSAGARTRRIALALATLGGAGFGIGLFRDRQLALFAYLSAYAFWLSMALGALIFLMIGHVMRATWPVAVRRITESLAATLPLFLPLFLPILLGLADLYPWVRPDSISDPLARELAHHRRAYLNPTFFSLRAIVLLTTWSLLSTLLRRFSLEQDRTGAASLTELQVKLSAAGLPIVGVTLTMAAIDWLMSLDLRWTSSMFGFYYFGGGMVGGLALITACAVIANRRGILPDLRDSHFYALGRLLLVFTSLWAYMGFFQYFLVWIANRPVETPWYILRTRTSWCYLSIGLAIGHFVLPFFALLSYRLKHLPRVLLIVAGWLVVFHYLDLYWIVSPQVLPQGPRLGWIELATLAGTGGIVTLFGLALLEGEAVAPLHDPASRTAWEYHSV